MLFSLLVTLCGSSVAQSIVSSKNRKAVDLYVEADNFRVRGQYKEAISMLSEAIERDKNFFEAYLRLGITYKALKDYERATEYLEKGLYLTREVRWQKVFWLELGEDNMRLGKYDRVIGYLEQYLQNETLNKGRIDQATLWKRSAEFSLQNMKKAIKFQPRQLSDTLNCFPKQYFPVTTADEQEMIFTRRLGFKDDDDEDLVVSHKSPDGQWTAPVSVSPNINSKFNEGTCTISADGRQLIFTSCLGRRGFGNCDLFESRKIGEEWTAPMNLGPQINSPAWESQPSLSADGRVLYFVSDRRGGQGSNDIYVSRKSDDGKWSKAKNLGKTVNTQYDEISPFIHANDRALFFASTGRPGFGGYDIFLSERTDSVWSMPQNFGYPINNHEDQFSLFISPDSEKGYYSHEEDDLNGISRIYEFFVPEEYRLKYKSSSVKGFVRDSRTHEPVEAKVELFNLETNEIVSLTYSDSVTGQYLMVLTQGADYALYVNSPGYLFKSLNFDYELKYDPKPIVIDIDLDKASEGAVVVLNNIFFDVDKYDLKPKSTTELDKIARFLSENPHIKVEISGHTDDQGAAAYNQQLSERRAKAVGSYLLEKGVAAGRLKQIGYGSRKPLQPNDSESNRQLNRRIEFKIIK